MKNKIKNEDKLEFNFVGSGWDVEGVNYIKINLLLDKEKLMKIKPNDKGFIKLTLSKKKNILENKSPYYIREFFKKNNEEISE